MDEKPYYIRSRDGKSVIYWTGSGWSRALQDAKFFADMLATPIIKAEAHPCATRRGHAIWMKLKEAAPMR